MFRFENPQFLWLLCLLPLLAAGYRMALSQRQARVAQLGSPQLVNRLFAGYSPRLLWQKFGLWLAALACLVLALSNPQMGTKTEKVKRKGIDLMIALDVSQSMLAEDVAPDRLARAKQAIERIIENRKGDRLGLVVFAGTAFLQMPLSNDYAAAKLFLQSVNTDIMPTQGTAISQAIDISIQSFKDEDKKYKALLIISDGEDHQEGAVDLAQKAAEKGIIVYCMGIGSEKGSTIPVYAEGRRVDIKRDENGQEVITKLNPEALKNIAEAGKGSYFRISDTQNELNGLVKTIDSMEKRDFEERVFTDYASHFQYFIFAAILLLSAAYLMPERQKNN